MAWEPYKIVSKKKDFLTDMRSRVNFKINI